MHHVHQLSKVWSCQGAHALGRYRIRHIYKTRARQYITSQCLEGNPLAHMLDCRAFKQGWQVNKYRSSKPNAMLVPCSDNTTGRVSVAVLALRDITVASRQDICIDYGDDYWAFKADHDSYMQLAKQQCSREQFEGLKEELKKVAEQLCERSRVQIAIKHALTQLLTASSAAMLVLSQQPGSQAQVAELAAAAAAATLVLHDNQQAVAAAVTAEVGSQVQISVDQAQDALAAEHAATVRRLKQELQEMAAERAALELQQTQLHQQQRIQLHQQHAAKVQELQAQLDKQTATASNVQQQLQGRNAVVGVLQTQQQLRDPQQEGCAEAGVLQRRHVATVCPLQEQAKDFGAVGTAAPGLLLQQQLQQHARAQEPRERFNNESSAASNWHQELHEWDVVTSNLQADKVMGGCVCGA